MAMKTFETSDLALATFLHCSGITLSSINRQNARRSLFVFENPKPELLSKWQEGKATVNALAYYNAYQALKAKVFGRGE